MSQSNTDISNVLKDRLQKHSTTISFDSVWSNYEKSNKRYFGIKRTAAIPMIALITLLAVFTVSFASYGVIRTTDNIDYPFVDDQRVIGKWQSVDFVESIGKFDPDKRAFPDDDFYLSEFAFIKGGDMLIGFEGGKLAPASPTWTRGLILDKQDRTASKYEIKEIEGQTYMFFEWKSGDYRFRGLAPKYYVMRKADSNDYANIDIPRKEDNIDYPFVNAPQMLGSWQCVDFVENIDDFKPGVKSWLDDLFLTELIIQENGELYAKATSGDAPKGLLTWTESLIINNRDKTASKCEIREIDGETYMFFEWKNGDYIFRGMEPSYYVLKKVE